ncbi:MAG TPA: M48 family metallopeptidase [Devosia sp.]|nr:M48 family metallopeptidase [Devosia sp.]
MEFFARYQNGEIAELRDVVCVVDLAAIPVTLVILDAKTRAAVDSWVAFDVFARPARALELRLGSLGRAPGARLSIAGVENMRNARRLLPSLRYHQRRDFWRQAQIGALATLALLSVIVAYVYGVPLLAERLVAIVPPDWEKRLGDTAAGQIEIALTDGKGFEICDPDPNSAANRAIARFVDDAFAGLKSPFTPNVTVVRSDIPNAFALPGGQAYYLSALLDASQTPEEFAGVLSHELGHVYYRHAMETLISTSATGLLVGFILGDMTGISIPAAIGSALIDNRFSRNAERQADSFAAATAQRLGYSPAGLFDLLDRVAKDDAFGRALALFSNHPLTDERRAALEVLDTPVPNARPPFNSTEWAAIKAMCPPPPQTESEPAPEQPIADPSTSAEPVSPLDPPPLQQ